LLICISDLSTHQKQQLALAKQIAELEQEAIGPKDWTLMGEATSRARPENSLLEEDLDFEHTAKVVPVVTEETVKTLEELIKRRILDVHHSVPLIQGIELILNRTNLIHQFEFELMNLHRSYPLGILIYKIHNLQNPLLRYMKMILRLLLREVVSRIQEMRS